MTLDKALVKASNKEGGKKGIDLGGMSDMGGVKYFNVVVESAGDEMGLMDAILEGMNAEIDEAAEERRGGAGHLGKLLLSAGDKSLLIVANIPKDLQESKPEITLKDWVDKVVHGAGGEPHTVESHDPHVVKIKIDGNPEKELFPLKMRDAAQAAGFAFLREKGLLPDDDDSDDYIPDPAAAGIEW